jgi:D-alanine-D-alanine ligase-like ATP-grasp enzyme
VLLSEGTKRTVLTFRFVLVAVAVIAALGLVHVQEIASTPIALIVAWKFDGFVLRYQAAREIRRLTGLGPDEVVRLSPDELSERMKERRDVDGSLKR